MNNTTISDKTLEAIGSLQNNVIPKKQKQKKLPVYLTEEEFIDLIKATRKPHHKLAYNLAYGAGLRIGEVISLLPENLDFKSKRIFIRNAKGGKDRIVPIPKGMTESNLKLLPLKCGIRALEIAFKGHAKKAKVFKEGLVYHSLRHSFSVRCMEKGMPLNTIQILLGHENISTTSIYTRINPKDALESYEKYW